MRLLVFLLCSVLIISFIPAAARGAPGVPLKDKFQDQAPHQTVEFDENAVEEPYYSEIKQGYEEKGYKPTQGIELVLDAKDITASDKGYVPTRSGIGGKDQAVLAWESSYSWFEWSVDIPQDGLYEIAVEYYPLQGSGSAVQRELRIDGQIPFMEAYNITFYRMWRDEGEPKVNNIGDEVRPRQVEVVEWRTAELTDNQGMYSEPFQFFFSKGKHTIRLDYVDQPVAIGRIFIRSPRVVPTYDEVAAQYKAKGYHEASQTIKFQAEENAILKSDPTIRRESNGDPATEPISRGNRVLNVLGDWRWRKGGQSITWEFEVPEDGLYKIGMRLAQWWGDGLSSYRQIAIDGQVPFAELEEYEFKYKQSAWRTEELKSSSGQPYLFYLTKGKHTLTMTVTMGPLTDIVHEITDDALLVSNITRRIIMITGNDPDPNYEYELDTRIPNLMDDLKRLSDSMQKEVDKLAQISTKRSSMANNFLTIKAQVDKMIADPDRIPRYLNDLNNAQISLGSWIRSLQERPLVIDYFLVGPPETVWTSGHSNILQKLYTTWVNFVVSFSKDYDSVGSVYAANNKDSTVINVWVARGKEWAEIMKEMADEDFTPNTGISVNMNVVPSSQLNTGSANALMLAITANKAPDVALGVSADSPVEFAIRGATVNLAQFSDFNEISKRFLPGVMIPFKYGGGTYALPETMGFQALFYRKDIIKELGLSLPDTWQDLYENVLPVLYQNGMEFGYPTGNFSAFLFQLGGNFYNEDGTKSALDTPEAYQAFKEYTELYTSYGVPAVANIFNRMRSGEMPMAVGGYDLYMQLATAAPELFGRWGIAPIPGHKKPDGTIDRTIGGSITGQAAIILSQSKHKDAAWEFLKWWTSAPVQMRFGRELEALMGVEARWNTANLEAFQGLPWPIADMRVIQQSWQWYKEQPVVLGGYFTSRHLNNAWNRVVLGDMNVRDSLEMAVKDINKELKAKQEEYGVTPQGSDLGEGGSIYGR